jgi:pimeloyl-ACP methyl ester carboxylesterase
MRRVHWAVEKRAGRILTSRFLNTRINQGRWDPVPLPPAEAAARIAPTPLLIVHGDRDDYFPADHADQLFEAANQPKELWIVPGFAHAESGASGELVDRIARWALAAADVPVSPKAVPSSPNAVA